MVKCLWCTVAYTPSHPPIQYFNKYLGTILSPRGILMSKRDEVVVLQERTFYWERYTLETIGCGGGLSHI